MKTIDIKKAVFSLSCSSGDLRFEEILKDGPQPNLIFVETVTCVGGFLKHQQIKESVHDISIVTAISGLSDNTPLLLSSDTQHVQ